VAGLETVPPSGGAPVPEAVQAAAEVLASQIEDLVEKATEGEVDPKMLHLSNVFL